MATYLIDYENVKSEGIRGIVQLSSEDRVIIFYSHNADTLTFETMDMIFSSKAAVSKYKIVRGGKNALDFQLSTYLGYLIHEGKDSRFYIISKDNGFQHVVEFWKRTFNYDGYVYCFATIADAYTRQRRFDNASAKEREKAMEEDMLAIQQFSSDEPSFAQDDDTDPVCKSEETSDASVQTAAPDEAQPPITAQIPVPSEESESAEDAAPTEDTPAESADAEEPQPAPAAPELQPETPDAPFCSEKPDDSFITETIHESNITDSPVPTPIDEPLDDEAKTLAFHDMLAEKIAAAVVTDSIQMTVVENNVTVHQVTDDPEPAAPAESAEPCEPVSPALTEADKSAADSSAIQMETKTEASDEHREEAPAQAEISSESAQKTAAPAESTAPAPKKKPRQSPRRRSAQKQTADSEQIASKKEESAVSKKENEEPQQKSTPETQQDEEGRRKPVRRPGRRKKSETEQAAEQHTAESHTEKHTSQDSAASQKPAKSRGRRPKAAKSEAAAFTD